MGGMTGLQTLFLSRCSQAGSTELPSEIESMTGLQTGAGSVRVLWVNGAAVINGELDGAVDAGSAIVQSVDGVETWICQGIDRSCRLTC
eukprot:940227-Rhodomonas_salina.1